MAKEARTAERGHAPAREEEILVLPLAVLHFDPHQPRSSLENIPELANSIEDQGLQQPITANRWKEIDGVLHYMIFKGARRYQSHVYLSTERQLPRFATIKTIVPKEWYDGNLSMERKLAQWAENSGREESSKKDTIIFLRQLLEDERARRMQNGENERGSIQVAVGRLCSSSGKSKAWGDQYVALCGLIPEMVDLLDSREDDSRLNMVEALHLSRLPKELQIEKYVASQDAFQRNGHKGRAAFFHQQIKNLKTQAGIKPQGRPIDDKNRFIRCAEDLQVLSDRLAWGRVDDEYSDHVKETLASMNRKEKDLLLSALTGGLEKFEELSERLREETGNSSQPAIVVAKEVPAHAKVEKSDGQNPATQKSDRPKKFQVTGRHSWPSLTQEADPFRVSETKPNEKGYVSRVHKGTSY